MLRGYRVITVTHKSINIGDLGDYVVPEVSGDVYTHVREAKTHFGLDEIMYLQTCNRVLFVIYNKEVNKIPKASDLFAFFHPEKSEDFYRRLDQVIQEYENIEAIEHLFAVASSIDSLVVGEREILRQLRTAYENSQKADLCGDSIRLLMRVAVETAKKVYDQTRIGEKPVSVASLATHMVLDHGIHIDDPILLVGAGETNTIIAKLLHKKGFHNISVFNRTYAKAQFLAHSVAGSSYPLSSLASYTKPWKAMIVCTAAPSPIITPELFSHLKASNTYQDRIIVDLAIPQNVHPLVAKSDEMTYIEVEGVRHKAEEHLNFRRTEVLRAQEILDDKTQEFHSIFQQRQIEKALRDIPHEIHKVKEKALSEVYAKQLEQLDEKSKTLVLEMMDYMEKKCVGIPMKAARTIV